MEGFPEDVHGRMKEILKDPLLAVLLKNSSLTEAQFETFLAQAIWQRIVEEEGSKLRKGALRASKPSVTRGSFNRTLNQARTNIVRSIYTLFLLGYAGLFDTPRLEPFIELSNQLRSYAVNVRKTAGEGEMVQAIAAVKEALRDTLERMAGQRSLRDDR